MSKGTEKGAEPEPSVQDIGQLARISRKHVGSA